MLVLSLRQSNLSCLYSSHSTKTFLCFLHLFSYPSLCLLALSVLSFIVLTLDFFNTSKASVSDTCISFSIRGTLFIPIQLYYAYDLKISFGERFVTLSRCESLTTFIPICMHACIFMLIANNYGRRAWMLSLHLY